MLLFAESTNQGMSEMHRQQDAALDGFSAQFAKTSRGGEHTVDERLILAAKEGDLNAFNELVLAHQDSLYWWIFSFVKDEFLACDLAQSTFITAYEKLSIYHGGSFRAWLFSIARNRSIDELRRFKRHPSISLDAAASNDDDRDFLSFLPTGSSLPEDVIIQGEQTGAVYRLIERLPQSFQQALQLVDIDGLDYRDAAGLLGLPLGTFKSRLCRARLKLRELVLHSREFAGN